MPSTTPERAARWPGIDAEAVAYLEDRGFTLSKDWLWTVPSKSHKLSFLEEDAILYLLQEWDYGGLTD